MPTEKRDVAKEIREKSIRDNAAASKAKTKSKEKKPPAAAQKSKFAQALSDMLDVFKVGRTVKKAADK